jgi:Tol biopolymer transport system component
VNVATDGCQANGASYAPAVSGDGRYLVFDSGASNLVPGDTAICPPDPNCWDVFVPDRLAGTTERVSVAADGTERTGTAGSPAMSGDGRPVAYSTAALVPDDTNGVADIFVRDRQTGVRAVCPDILQFGARFVATSWVRSTAG